MAEGILGLGSGQAASLNQDLIDKLKAAEKKATVEPIESNLEKIITEKETFAKIETKVDELLKTIKPFDLFVSGGVNAFNQKAATTSGSSAGFDAVDVSKLNSGVTTVNITKLAQKDVYQSDRIDKDNYQASGTFTIKGESIDTSTYTSYDDLVKAINGIEGISASIQHVGTDSSNASLPEYRIVIKSDESGIDNSLNISAGALGGELIQTAQNMEATVDGVGYSLSANELEVDGLKITAKEIGVSSINVSSDNTQIQTQIETFVTKYNEFVSLIDGELNSASSSIQDKSILRGIRDQIKDKIFGTYGENSDKSIFTIGFELDKNGFLSVDSTKIKDAIENDLQGLQELFIGSASKEGFGTQLKAVIDELSFTGGALTTYEKNMNRREEVLKEDKEKAEESLNAKYEQLALQFGSYGAIINQFEAQFSGLKLMIQQSTAG